MAPALESCIGIQDEMERVNSEMVYRVEISGQPNSNRDLTTMDPMMGAQIAGGGDVGVQNTVWIAIIVAGRHYPNTNADVTVRTHTKTKQAQQNSKKTFMYGSRITSDII